MKFGYFCNTTNWTHKPYDKLLDETREITEYCDKSKWDSIWYTEHHFNHEGMESLTNQRFVFFRMRRVIICIPNAKPP